MEVYKTDGYFVDIMNLYCYITGKKPDAFIENLKVKYNIEDYNVRKEVMKKTKLYLKGVYIKELLQGTIHGKLNFEVLLHNYCMITRTDEEKAKLSIKLDYNNLETKEDFLRGMKHLETLYINEKINKEIENMKKKKENATAIINNNKLF